MRSPELLLVFSFDFLLLLRDIPVLEHTNDTVIEDIIFIFPSATYFDFSIKNNYISENVNEVHFYIHAKF